MSITESQRRTLDLMAESAGWNWADVEALSQQLCGECVAGLTHRQAEIVMAELEWAGKEQGKSVAESKRPCDYVSERTAENAKACERCGDPAWDICYDGFLCDACVAVLDAEMNEHARKLNEDARRRMEVTDATGE